MFKKENFKFALAAVATLGVISVAFCVPTTPVDGGVSILAAVGVAVGIKKLFNK